MTGIFLGFTVKGYPGSGRRTEDETDLASCHRIDLIQGAFMGDFAMTLGDLDFSSRFGWVTLLGWLLSLANSAHVLETADTHVTRFAESDDFLSFRRHSDLLFIASSYRPGIAQVEFARFVSSIDRFVDEQLAWIIERYPSVTQNPVMADVVSRIK